MRPVVTQSLNKNPVNGDSATSYIYAGKVFSVVDIGDFRRQLDNYGLKLDDSQGHFTHGRIGRNDDPQEHNRYDSNNVGYDNYEKSETVGKFHVCVGKKISVSMPSGREYNLMDSGRLEEALREVRRDIPDASLVHFTSFLKNR